MTHFGIVAEHPEKGHSLVAVIGRLKIHGASYVQLKKRIVALMDIAEIPQSVKAIIRVAGCKGDIIYHRSDGIAVLTGAQVKHVGQDQYTVRSLGSTRQTCLQCGYRFFFIKIGRESPHRQTPT